ncbi:uncharacterized protein [Diadema antillarum]|uniref:uncharacterized protein n=1 Tax=Diadema antillarum TaxID=105358 RepID=UPI003A85457D
MANSTVFEAAPVDFHLSDSDVQNLETVLHLQQTTSSARAFPVPRATGDAARPGGRCEKYLLLDNGCSNCNSSTWENRLLSDLTHMVLRKYAAIKRQKPSHHRAEIENQADSDLGPHEMLVIGTQIDERILPGFRYRVRIRSQKRLDRFQFGGQALSLTRIGQGYGKRLTFESTLANINPNYFWSDTHPNGYAFIISAVQPGEQFVLCHPSRRPFGRATVVAASQHQIEVDSRIEGKISSKSVLVAMRIAVTYTCAPHGMLSLRADEVFDVTGVALVVKASSSSKAVTKVIQEVMIPGQGECLLFSEQD